MARRSHATDPATRAHALERAGEIGDAAAAEEAGIALPTLRSWRHRANQAPADDAPAAAAAGRTAEQLRAEADAARGAERRAVQECGRLLASEKATAAKAASGVAADAAARAVALERAARDVEQHDARMREQAQKLGKDDLNMLRSFARLYCSALGLGWGPEQEALFWACGRAFEGAERLPDGRLRARQPEPETRQARAAIDRLLERREPDFEVEETEKPSNEQIEAEARAVADQLLAGDGWA